MEKEYVSEAAQQFRDFNPETAKIITSEKKIKLMERSSHAI